MLSNSELAVDVGFARMRKLALSAKATFTSLKELAHLYVVPVTISWSSRRNLATGGVGIRSIALRLVSQNSR